MTSSKREKAKGLVNKYTAAAAVTGAIPLPAASGAIIAENAAMVAHVSAIYSSDITLWSVIENMGTMATLNMAGRALFIEIAKTLGWGVGGPLPAILLSGAGAATAGVQTFILGMLTIEICENGGEPLPSHAVKQLVAHCRSSYDELFGSGKERETAQAGT